MARRHSLPIGRRSNIFKASNNIAIGMVYSTNEDSELTILNSVTEQTGMNPHRARNVI